MYQKESSTKNEIYQNVYKKIQNKAMFVIVLKKQQYYLLNNRNISLLSLGTISQSLSCTSLNHNKWSTPNLHKSIH